MEASSAFSGVPSVTRRTVPKTEQTPVSGSLAAATALTLRASVAVGRDERFVERVGD